MTEQEIARVCTMDRFAGGLIAYLEDYFDSKYGVYHRPIIHYEIPNEDYFVENARDLLEEIRTLKPLRDYSLELKKIAQQYLPVFLQEYPHLKNEECLKL